MCAGYALAPFCRMTFVRHVPYNRNMLSRHIFVLVLLYPILAHAAIPIGAAQPVTQRVPGIAAGRQDEAAVASSGRETLVAWRDERLGRAGLYVALLSDDGTVAAGKQRWLVTEQVTSLALTWTGQSYLLVWFSSNHAGTWAMTIDAELRTLTPARRIHDTGGLLSNITWSGSRGAVMSSRTLLILDPAGNVVASPGDVLENLSPFENARVAASGQTFAVFAHFREESSTLFARRYDTNGEELDPHPVQILQLPRISDDWDAAFGDGNFALVMTELAPFHEGTHELWRYIVDPATLQARALGALTIGASSGAHVEWIGDRFLALWLDRYPQSPSLRIRSLGEEPAWGVYSLRMLPFTASTDSSIVISPDRIGVALNLEEAWTGSKLTVAYRREPAESAGRDVYAETIDFRTGAATSTAVAMSTQWQSMAAGDTHGATTLVAWLEGDPWTDAMRVATTPIIGGNSSAPVLYLADDAFAVPPVVVSTSSMYLVFWLERNPASFVPRIAMQRLSREGTPLDATPTNVANGFSIAAAWNGTHVAIVWVPFNGNAHVARLTADGRFVDAVPVVIPAALGAPPQIASNGTDFLVVLPEGSDGEFPQPDLMDLRAARVTSTGTAEPSFPVAIGPSNQRMPAVASDGRDYVIAYVETTPSERDTAIVTKKVLREGVLAGTTADAPGTSVAAISPSLARLSIADNDNGYFVTWEETTNAFTGSVHLAGIDRDGEVNEPPVTIAESEIEGTFPIVVPAIGPTAHLLYSLPEVDLVYGTSMRLLTRQLGEKERKQRAVRR